MRGRAGIGAAEARGTVRRLIACGRGACGSTLPRRLVYACVMPSGPACPACTEHLNLETHETLTTAYPLRAERRRDVHVQSIHRPVVLRDGYGVGVLLPNWGPVRNA